MQKRSSRTLFAMMLTLLVASWSVAAQAITVTPFGATGAGGSINGQTATIGSGGALFQVESFLAIGGTDLNGGNFGTAAPLSSTALPSGIGFSFGSSLSADGTDLTLSYSITNQTGSDLSNLTFVSFVDAEIDEPLNTFFNEYATTSGTLAAGQNFEVGDPFGGLFANALSAQLSGVNGTSLSNPNDVAMALSFDLAALSNQSVANFEIMISEDGSGLGSFALTQRDVSPSSPTTITYSGRASVAAIPEPSAALVFGLGAALVGAVTRRRG